MSYNDKSLAETMAVGTIATIGVAILVAIAGFLGLLYGVFAGGFVGMKLWAWFIVPVFGFKTLTIVQAWGIALLVGLWTHQVHVPTNKDEREPVEKFTHFAILFLYPWLILLLGWLGKTLFM